MEHERADMSQIKASSTGHQPPKGLQASKADQPQGGVRAAEQSHLSRSRPGGMPESQGYFDDGGFGDFEAEEYGHGVPGYGGHFGGHHAEETHRGYGHMDPYSGHLMHEGQRGGGMKEDFGDLALINPLLYKPASKPPVIREGDWLCPDVSVVVDNVVLQCKLGKARVL